MRCVTLALLAVAAVAAGVAREPAAGLHEGYTGFALPAEPVLPAQETHPSLWFRSAEVPALAERIAHDDFSRDRWAAVVQRADLAAALPAAPVATDRVDQIHQYYGAMSLAARAHALAALLEPDGGRREAHRRRAVALLERAYDGPIFELDSNTKGSAVDEIYRGCWLQNYGHAYDCIQPTLDAAADQRIRERLAREAQCVSDHLNEWTPTSPHNHLSKPAWGLGSIALTLSADPRARTWLARALAASNRNTRYFFSGDGLYREGSHYLVFSLTNFLPFLYHYRNVSGVDGFPVFQPAFEAMVAVRNSRGWLPNLEDSYLRPTPTHLAAGAYRHARTWLHSAAPLAEVLQWSYTHCDLTPFNLERTGSGFNYTGASWDYSLETDELLTWDPALKSTPPDAAPDAFLTGGQSVFRRSWTGTGAGQRYLLFHGVAVADNHNHDDQLSFILEAEGQLMCSDAGYSRGTYAGGERLGWYATAPAHNTVTFDGQPAEPRPSNATPTSRHWTQPDFAAEEKSTTLPGGARWTRSIVRVAGDAFAVVDRFASDHPGEWKAFLHGGRGALASTGAQHTWRYAADRYGSAAQLLTWIATPGATTMVKSGELTYIKGDFAEFPYLETAGHTITAPWITLLQPAAEGAPAPTVGDESHGQVTALVLTSADATTSFAARLAGSPAIAWNGIETDAGIVIVRRDRSGKRLGHFAIDATYLRIDGQAQPLAP